MHALLNHNTCHDEERNNASSSFWLVLYLLSFPNNLPSWAMICLKFHHLSWSGYFGRSSWPQLPTKSIWGDGLPYFDFCVIYGLGPGFCWWLWWKSCGRCINIKVGCRWSTPKSLSIFNNQEYWIMIDSSLVSCDGLAGIGGGLFFCTSSLMYWGFVGKGGRSLAGRDSDVSPGDSAFGFGGKAGGTFFGWELQKRVRNEDS